MRKINSKFTLSLAILAVLILVGGAYFLGINQGKSQNQPEKIHTVADNYKEQLPALAAAVKKDSTDSKARREYAVALYATGDFEKAKEQYMTDIKQNVGDSVTYNNLGNIYREQGKSEEAIKMYEKAITLDEKNINAYLNLAHVYTGSLSKSDDAIKVYREALDKNPNDAKVQTQLALVYERNGNLTEALDVYKSMLDQNANNPTVREAIQRLENQI